MVSVCLALLATGCGSGSGSGGAGGSTDNGGASGSASGGSAGSASGGSAGSASGGSAGGVSGGSAGNASGGSAGNAKGGAAGSASGGSAGSGNGNGGSAGSANGGAAGSNPGGSPGGSAAGGSQAAGGSSSTGGTPMPSTALITSAANAYWKTDAKWTEVTSGNATVTVNDTEAQSWEGFGGAFNELGWSYLTSKDMQDKALQLLFGDDGCRFAWGRIPIGASDYATSRYTDDEVSSGSDTSMSSFSIDRDKEKLIPYIKAAQAVKSDIKFWGSPWTPPTWMKATPYLSPGNPVNAFDGGTMKSDDATLKAHAQYFVKWVQAFQEQGIKIEYVAPQNEPNYQQNYPSCHWDTANFVKFVGSYLGPALTAANLSTKVMDGTLSNTSGDSDIGQQVLKDSTAKSFVGAIGVQWGMAAANQVSTLKGLAGGIPIWISEHQCGGTMGSTAPAPNDLGYAKDSWGYIRDAVKNGLTAYNAWNMVLDKGGLGIDNTRKWPQNALLVADSGQVNATPAYYVFRHVSQYVDPGAKVVGTSTNDSVAFKNPDGSIVAAMYNSGGANANYIVSIGGKKLQFSMPAAGWATVKYKP
jgi:glucosylceramidase